MSNRFLTYKLSIFDRYRAILDRIVSFPKFPYYRHRIRFRQYCYRYCFREKMWNWKQLRLLPIVSDRFHPCQQRRTRRSLPGAGCRLLLYWAKELLPQSPISESTQYWNWGPKLAELSKLCHMGFVSCPWHLGRMENWMTKAISRWREAIMSFAMQRTLFLLLFSTLHQWCCNASAGFAAARRLAHF